MGRHEELQENALAERITLGGRVAIITGAGRGLGRAHALEFARRGARIVVNDPGFNLRGDDSGDAAPADSVVREIIAAGGTAVASNHDIAQPDQVRALVDLALGTWDRLDIVVNNAGNNRRATFPEATLDDFRSLLDVHLIGAFLVTQAAYRAMVKAGYGRIVMTSSQVGFYGKVDSLAYGAAKAGLLGLMHGIKLDGAPHGIRVNAISPFALTRMGNIFPHELERLIDPAQVSAAVAYLASEACQLNGEILIAGGGHFALARTVESRGIDIDDPAEVSAEMVARRWDEIADMKDARIYPDALQAVGVTFSRLKKLAGLG
jgi:NAD(P)-dependent dehydrogenase (short-subunit alcohol dehydrogenase family)